ncbi:unnamed protein product [Rhizophagus irregularis]|nr:unnamed protein product [Rhizophagus irregularis]
MPQLPAIDVDNETKFNNTFKKLVLDFIEMSINEPSYYYVTHYTCRNLYVVDRLMEFSNSRSQLYTLEEVFKKVYMFKSRTMDYYTEIQKNLS